MLSADIAALPTAAESDEVGEVDSRLRPVTVDLVVVTRHPDLDDLGVLLIQRDWPPYKGKWALPGGFFDEDDEDFIDAAMRELEEETGLALPASALRLFGVYGKRGRDPRGPVATAAYLAVLDHVPPVKGGDDARDAQWLAPLSELLADPDRLAFDHHRILSNAAALLPGMTSGGTDIDMLRDPASIDWLAQYTAGRVASRPWGHLGGPAKDWWRRITRAAADGAHQLLTEGPGPLRRQSEDPPAA